MILSEKIGEITEKNRIGLIMGLTLMISVAFTAVISLRDVNAMMYKIFPGITGGLMVLFFYMAWKNYHLEKRPFEISILWSVLGVIVSLITFDAGRTVKMCGVFLIMMSPVFVISISHHWVQRRIKNRRLACLGDILVFLLPAFWIFTATGGDLKEDFLIVAVWSAQSVLWSLALGSPGDSRRRRRLKLWTWTICLALFYLFTIAAEPFIWSSIHRTCWNRALYLGCPVLLAAAARRLLAHSPENEPRRLWKVCGVYAGAAALLIWNDIFLQLIYQPVLRYSPDRFLYFLIIADMVLMGEILPEFKDTLSRKQAAFGAVAVNIAAIGWLFYENIKMFAGDRRLFDQLYGRAAYMDVIRGCNLLSVTHELGFWPVLLLTALLLAVLFLLWSWNGGGAPVERLMKYLAAGYGIRMVFSAVPAVLGIVVSTTFPFADYAVAELALLAIVLLHSAQNPPQRNFKAHS